MRRAIEQFFDNVNKSLAHGKPVLLDFREVKQLYPCGVLILMGWVDEWILKYPNMLSATYPKDDIVEQMLQHVGVLQKLDLDPRTTPSHTDVVRWHYFHGNNADATPMEGFMLQLQKILGQEQQLGLGNCVTEAMTNVRHHAYDRDKNGSWWIFATVNQGQVFVALHDRGASVPATLLAKPGFSDYVTGRRWSLGSGDGQLIAAAIGGRTSTELPYRGKGLPEMLEFTKKYPNSELGIFKQKWIF